MVRADHASLVLYICLHESVPDVFGEEGRYDGAGLHGLGEDQPLSALDQPVVHKEHQRRKDEDHGHSNGEGDRGVGVVNIVELL
jgi:hypothetical protein